MTYDKTRIIKNLLDTAPLPLDLRRRCPASKYGEAHGPVKGQLI
jgi:hypothetical protein